MENWQLALWIIAAIFVGTMIPMIIQLMSTLKSLNRLIRANESDVRRTMTELAQFSAHLNRVGASVESNKEHVESLFHAVGDLTDGVRRIRGSLRTASLVGAAVAPAVGAAIRALQTAGHRAAEPENGLMKTPDAATVHELEIKEREVKKNGASLDKEKRR